MNLDDGIDKLLARQQKINTFVITKIAGKTKINGIKNIPCLQLDKNMLIPICSVT